DRLSHRAFQRNGGARRRDRGAADGDRIELAVPDDRGSDSRRHRVYRARRSLRDEGKAGPAELLVYAARGPRRPADAVPDVVRQRSADLFLPVESGDAGRFQSQPGQSGADVPAGLPGDYGSQNHGGEVMIKSIAIQAVGYPLLLVLLYEWFGIG